MSKYNERPYIETILGEVSGENKAKLLNFINGKSADGTSTISFTVINSITALNALAAGITPIAYKYSNKITWKGYYIRTTNYKSFLTFKNGTDLSLGELYKVDSTGIAFIEYVSADNARTILREDAYIDVSELPAVPSEETIKGYAVAAVEAAESGTPATVLGLDENGDLVKGAASSGGFDDMEVELSTSGAGTSTSYADPISGADFITACESGQITTAGQIARITNKNTGEKFRIILLGTNHDVLAKDGITKAKTTWSFYEMFNTYIRLGLPFNIIDMENNSGRSYANSYLDGTNTGQLNWYPSSAGGYPTAVGLHDALHTIFETLPLTLKTSIKLVNKTINIPRKSRYMNAHGGTEGNNLATSATICSTLFIPSVSELGGSSSYGTEGNAYAYTSPGRYDNAYGSVLMGGYWLRTPSLFDASSWCRMGGGGGIQTDKTDISAKIVPAFCI